MHRVTHAPRAETPGFEQPSAQTVAVSLLTIVANLRGPSLGDLSALVRAA
jgi:hypothetical protein